MLIIGVSKTLKLKIRLISVKTYLEIPKAFSSQNLKSF